MQDVDADELKGMAGKLKTAVRKLEALALALEMNEEPHYRVDGKKMADEGVRRILNFVANCEKAGF